MMILNKLFFYYTLKIQMNEDYVEIDGSLHEGGGQMIRSSLALSQIFKKGFRMHSIRKNRPNPGINNQLRSVFSAFSQKVPQVGETQIYIYPHFNEPTLIKSSTAASCTLMLQCFIPVFAALGYDRPVKIQGGTDVSRSPCLESIELGLKPLMKQMGVNLQIQQVKKGYYPKGNGHIVIRVFKEGEVIQPIKFINFSPPQKVVITYYVKGKKLPAAANNLKNQVKSILQTAFPPKKVKVELKVESVFLTKDDYGIGCICIGQGVVWDCGTVGQKVTQNVILQRLRAYTQKKVCLDEHHQDQLILLATLAQGTSKLYIGELSLHTESMLYVIKQFLPEFKYSHEEGILQIEGVGYKGIGGQKMNE